MGETCGNFGWTARAWLFRPGGTVGSVYTTVQDEFDRLMTFMSTVHDTDVFSLGSLIFGSAVPRVRTVSDIRVAEAVRQTLAAVPDAALWWDYSASSGVPVLYGGKASAETPLELTIGSANAQALSGYQLRPLPELIPTGVVLRYEGTASTSTGLGSIQKVDAYPGQEVALNCSLTSGSGIVDCDSTASLVVGMSVDQISGLVGPGSTISSITSATRFVLSQNALSTTSATTLILRAASGPLSVEPGVINHTVTDSIAYAPGAAKDLYTSLSQLRAQGSLTVVDRSFSLGLRPGRVITLTGDPIFEGVQLWVQTVRWNPDTGLADLTVGYPPHLQLSTLVDLRGWLRYAFNGPTWSYSWVVPPP